VKMLDFGLARLLPTTSSDPEAMTLAQQTTPGTVMGTLAYMSPEQASGQTVGSPSDVFALGIVLYELATGSHPFKSETMIGYLHAITSQTPPSMTSLKSHLPPALDDLILRMLEKNANNRPTAVEVVQALVEIEKYGSSNTLPIRIVTDKPKATPLEEGFWVAVLPFKVRDTDPEVVVLADGLSEEIVTGLSRFRYLSVVTSPSAMRLKGETEDELSLGAKLDTRYVLEGSIRKGGSVIRVSAQLVDTETGARLWSETYNRDLQTSSIFAVQDDVAARIVATVADSYGVLVHSMRAAIRKKDDVDLTPVEWQFQYFAYREQITPSAHAALKSRLLKIAEQNVGQSDVWACLAQIYVDEYAFGFQNDATSLDRALAAGRRAVELDRANQFALVALAQVHFFRQDLAAFAPAAERGMALNPLNTDAIGILGLQIVHTGQFERGAAIVLRAMELNPNHAGWMHFAPLWDHFHRGEYEQALECANRVDVPGLFWPYLVMASACGHLGRRTEAEAAVKDLLALDPEFAAHVRSNVESWHFASGLLEPLLEGLRKAGLEISDEEPTSTSSASSLASSETRSGEGFWVAVLPFKFTGSNTDVATLAEGLSEEIVTGLSRFSYLQVISRSSTLRYASETSDVRTVGRTLGARYVMEGSLRLGGSSLRVSVQVVDARTGAHVWAETYDRTFQPEKIFGLQDELVPKIVSSVADMHGALPRSMSEILRLKSSDQLSPYEALLRSFGYNERFTPEELGEVRTCLERAVDEAPANGDCWAMLSLMYANEYGHWHIHRPDSLDKALRAARTAVQAAPLHSLPYYALAQALFFRKETHSFRVAAERAVSLNPMDGAAAAFMGLLIAYSGDWERGCALAEKGLQLNPNHPGWYHYTAWHDAYRKQDYQTALDIALKLNAPDNFYTHAVLAMCYAQLGHIEAAHKSLRDILALKPDYAIVARELHGKWIEPDLVEQLMDGLRKAGLEIPDSADQSPSSTPSFVSSKARADEGFWVAVLPFKSSGRAKALKALAEGLSEDIVTGLSRFSYLHVIARGSTQRYANQTTDLRTVGKEIGARYVMEGSLRIAGSSLRVSVQLVDANTGAHLWAETYDRQFRAEEVFALQDDLVPRIVSTIADVNGVLPRSMSEVVCGKNPDELSPYEAVLRSFRYFDRVTPEELAAARSCLELAVEKAPSNSDAWAMLALLFHQDYGQGFNLHPDALNLGTVAAQRAVEAGPSNHLAYFSLAQARFFQKDFQSFRNAAERAVALNPMDGNSLAFMGELLTYVGDWERGLALASRAKQINPNHPGWFWYADYFHAYRQGDYRNALSFILKANLPGHWGMHAGIAAAAGQVGDSETASKAIRDLLKLRPDYGVTVHNTLAKWFDPELCEQLLDGLRKAGLKISGKGATGRDGDGATGFSSSGSFSRPAIVVLPFVNRSADPENEYFCDGLTEEIISDLSGIQALRIISRNSSMTFKGTIRDTLSIANVLGVSHVISGSVRRVGDDLRVTAELIEVASDTPLWNEKYSGTMANVFGIQEEIAQKVVSALKVRLTDVEKQQATKRPIQDVVAYDCYLRARQEMYRWTTDALDRASLLVDQALEIVGENSLLLATKGQIHWNRVNVMLDPDDRHLDQASDCARRALALDQNDYLAIFLLVIVAGLRGDRESALNDLYRAYQLRPGDPNVLTELCRFAYTAGIDVDKYVRELVAIDPLTPVTWCVVQYNHLMNGRFEESVTAARRVSQLTPDGSPARIFGLIGLAMAGQRDEAIALADLVGKHLSGTLHGSWALFFRHALAGDADRSSAEMNSLLERGASLVEEVSYSVAVSYSLIDYIDDALKWIRLATKLGFINYPFLATYDPLLANVRSDPRFTELMGEVRKRWELLGQSLPEPLKLQSYIERGVTAD